MPNTRPDPHDDAVLPAMDGAVLAALVTATTLSVLSTLRDEQPLGRADARALLGGAALVVDPGPVARLGVD